MQSGGEEDLSAFQSLEAVEGLSVEVVTTTEGMTLLRDDWKALEVKTMDSFTYFQGYDWCRSWVDAFVDGQPDRKYGLRIICIRRDESLVCLWPLVVRRHIFGIRIARFIGEPHTQYGNILIDGSKLTVREAEACWHAVRQQIDADSIVLDRLPEGSAASRILGSVRLPDDATHASSLMDLDQLESWQAYQQTIGRSARKFRNKRRRQLEAQGQLEFQLFSGGTVEFIDMVGQALEMKAKWLEASARPAGKFADCRTASLLAELDGNADRPSGAVASALMLDGRPISIEIGFCRDRHYYSFLGAFDWHYRSYSPGKVHLEKSLKWAMDAGMTKFDLLGVPSAYKAHWTNTTITLSCYGAATSLAGVVHARLWCPSLRPLAKRIFERMPRSMKRPVLSLLPVA